jgi:endogenous inhibitor of DNA gyrase (YacG/DUF329 family)
MPRWILICPGCNEEFTLSEVTSEGIPFTWGERKPDMPDDGASLECPHCEKPSVYKRHQLIYRAT